MKKKILEEYKSSSYLQKMSFIANIFTILGISLFPFIIGPFLSWIVGKPFYFIDFLLAGAFFSSYLIVLVFCIWIFIEKVIKFIQKSLFGKAIIFFIAGIISVCILISIYSPLQFWSTRIFKIQYFMPPAPTSIVSDILVTKDTGIYNIISKLVITGSVKFTSDVNWQDYEVALYTIPYISGKENTQFKIHIAEDGSYAFPITDDGKFTIPSIDFSQLNDFNMQYIVLYRRTDWSPVRWITSNFTGYPNNFSVIPDKAHLKLKSFIYRIPPNVWEKRAKQ